MSASRVCDCQLAANWSTADHQVSWQEKHHSVIGTELHSVACRSTEVVHVGWLTADRRFPVTKHASGSGTELNSVGCRLTEVSMSASRQLTDYVQQPSSSQISQFFLSPFLPHSTSFPPLSNPCISLEPPCSPRAISTQLQQSNSFNILQPLPQFLHLSIKHLSNKKNHLNWMKPSR